MKVLVPVKRVIDANIKVRVKSDQSGVELNNVKMAMNPFCEIAVEQAIRLKESGLVDEIIVVTVGAAQSQETLRAALAMGADRAILIETEETPEPLAVAKSLKAIVDREEPGLVILGKQPDRPDAGGIVRLVHWYVYFRSGRRGEHSQGHEGGGRWPGEARARTPCSGNRRSSVE